MAPNMAPRAPARAVLLGCMVVAIANGCLLGSAYLRKVAGQALEVQVQALRQNLATLSQLQADRRTQLQAQLAEADRRVALAESALPPVETPLDVFRIGYQLSGEPGVVVLSIRRDSAETQDTIIGPIDITRHRVTARGTLEACLAYVAALEAVGPGLGLAGVSILPEEEGCSLDVLPLGRAR